MHYKPLVEFSSEDWLISDHENLESTFTPYSELVKEAEQRHRGKIHRVPIRRVAA